MKMGEKVIKKSPILPDYAHSSVDFLTGGQSEKGEKEPARFFKIWYVEPRFDLTNYNQQRLLNRYLAEFGEDALEKDLRGFITWRNKKQDEILRQGEEYLELRKALNVVEEERIEKAQEDLDKRAFMINKMTPTDVSGEIELAFDIEKAKNPPEIIILRDEQSEFSETGLGSGTVNFIRKKIKENLKKFNLLDRESLLQPIIVVSVADEKLKTAFLEQGANLVVDDFNPQDINTLTQLVAKIKSDPSSLNTEKFLAEKIGFYEKIVENGFMGERGELSADTEKELNLLRDIIKEKKIQSILDIGSGSGRITNELGKDENLRILGVDTNEALLRMAEEKNPDKARVNYQKGRITDFVLASDNSDNFEQKLVGQYDAVTYTWNTILEAFGPGNLIKTLNNAWLALHAGGQLIFDFPTRENSFIKDGWYHIPAGEAGDYWAYIPEEKELKFILQMTGFDVQNIEFKKWQIGASLDYPEGIKKVTVVATKK